MSARDLPPRLCALPGAAEALATPHALHAAPSPWPQTNCYLDLWVGVLRALRLEPTACFTPVLSSDFEQDQWTFHKPSHDELAALYGVVVRELTTWRPLLDQTASLLALGRLPCIEVDAWWLPDTAETDYRQQHTKTTIAINALDAAARRVGYFHNDGYHQLEGEDFDALFGLAGEAPVLPMYAEVARFDRVVRHAPRTLRALARDNARRHLAARPADDPVLRFAAHFERELPVLRAHGMARYHRWAFAGTRQFGTAAQAGAVLMRWLAADDVVTAEDQAAAMASAAAFDEAAALAKSFILKGARCTANSRAVDATELFAPMAGAWSRALDAAARSVGA